MREKTGNLYRSIFWLPLLFFYPSLCSSIVVLLHTTMKRKLKELEDDARAVTCDHQSRSSKVKCVVGIERLTAAPAHMSVKI